MFQRWRDVFERLARSRFILCQSARLLLLQLARGGWLWAAGLRAAPATREEQQRKDESKGNAFYVTAAGALGGVGGTGVLHRFSISIARARRGSAPLMN
jgi:hypothetical protein